MAYTVEESANLKLVRDIYEQVLIPMDRTRVDDFIAPDYIQHSSLAEPGVAALKAWLDMVRVQSPEARQTIHRMFADGDHVTTHVHVVRWPGDPGLAVCDIFRCADGKVVEHWDVIQEIPEDPVNPNSMF
ncbi:MAG: nuclear transport factor 2 family protein [Chakrabartia godavariana]